LGTWLNKSLGLPVGKAAKVLSHMGLAITPGGLSHAIRRVGRAAEPTYEAMAQAARASPVAVADETGWRVEALSAWLWAFVSPAVALYAIRDGRGYKQASEVLGEGFSGALARDGWAPYRKFASARCQSCLAHLLRRCREMARAGHIWAGVANAVLCSILADALALRDGRRRRGVTAASLARRLDELISTELSTDGERRLVKHLANEREAILTFLSDPAVDAANWRAEQAIRPAVVNRKVWGGNRAWAGARTQEVLTSVLATAALQDLDPVDVLAGLQLSADPVVAPFQLTP
jgi:transposase